jgi:hypothetical protein
MRSEMDKLYKIIFSPRQAGGMPSFYRLQAAWRAMARGAARCRGRPGAQGVIKLSWKPIILSGRPHAAD